MKDKQSRINTFFEKIPDFVRKNRFKFVAAFICITLLAMAGLGRVQMDNSVSSFFEKDDPMRKTYDQFRVTFGSDEILYIVYKAKDGDVFSENSLKAVRGIQNELLQKFKPGDPELGHITDVDTIINVSFLEADEGSLISRDFIGDEIPTSPEILKRIARQALEHPDYPLLFVSKDSAYGGMVIRTDFNSRLVKKEAGPVEAEDSDFSFEQAQAVNEDQDNPEFIVDAMQDYVPFIKAVRAITDQNQYASHLDFYFAGNPELMGFIDGVLIKEMGIIILGSILLIMMVLLILFRSPSAVVWSLLLVIVTVIWLLGSIGWSGIPTGDTVNIIVFLLIAVGVADAVHILSGYLFFRRNNYDHQKALRSVYAKSGFACFLTSLTTAVGLMAMTMVPIVSMQRFGFFAALGVAYAFLITIFILPLMLDLWSPVAKKKKLEADPEKMVWVQKVLSHFLKVSLSSPVLVAAGFLIAGLVLGSGFFKVLVDSNMVTIIKEDRPIRHAYDVVDKEMAGTGNMEIFIDTKKIDGLKSPTLLKAIDLFQKQLEKEEKGIVKKSLSLANVTKDSFKALNEGKKEKYIIPDDPKVLAQTLFLFNSANPDDRRLFVSDDYRKARITINTRNLGSLEGISFMERVLLLADKKFAELKSQFPEMTIAFTGQIPLFQKMMDYMSWAQIKSFAVTLAAISFILLIALGSFRIGILAIFPNLLPVVTVFGVMGFFNIPLDLHTLLVIPIIIGISVDDTVHFLTHFRIEFTKTGNVRQAIKKAMAEAGQAIVFTSVVLAVGYLIFLIAVNKGFGYFGILSSVAILTATLADLVLLPSLLLIGFKNSKTERIEK